MKNRIKLTGVSNTNIGVSPLFPECTLYGMSDVRDDAALLDEYARTGSREIVGELARRHAGLVYSSARRQVGDGHLAEDVTQAVFILLFSKASSIKNPCSSSVGCIRRLAIPR